MDERDTGPPIPDCPPKCFDAVERRLGAIEDDLAELKARPKPTDLGQIPADLAVLTSQGAAMKETVDGISKALLGNGRPGLVTRMDRAERSLQWLSRVFWLVAAGVTGYGLKMLFARLALG